MALIFSTEVSPRITPTPLGLAVLDGSIGFTELLTIQALRFQYPNGHHVHVSPAQRLALRATPYQQGRTFAGIQTLARVLLRPAVLVWDVLRSLMESGAEAVLSRDEAERHLLRCSTNAESTLAARGILAARNGRRPPPRLDQRERRNVQDWFRFLAQTAVFSLEGEQQIRLSDFAIQNVESINAYCRAAVLPESFWNFAAHGRNARHAWYSWFGSVDLGELSAVVTPSEQGANEYVAGEEAEDQLDELPTHIVLRQFELPEQRAARHNRPPSIESVYSSELVDRAHRLHDNMVRLIGATCSRKGARVFEDPATVDLLVDFRDTEFLIEVKSVNSRNLVRKIRLAIGQVWHYDYLRSLQRQAQRRRAIAVTGNISDNHWSVPFITRHIDMDLICLREGRLVNRTHDPLSAELFA